MTRPHTPDDEFMYARRESPRPEFAESLRQELQASTGSRPSQQRRLRTVFGMSQRFWQRIAAMLLLISGVFAVSFAVSPDVRAMTRSLLGIDAEVPLEVAQDAIGFQLPQHVPYGYQMLDICSNVVQGECESGSGDINVSLDVNESGSGWAAMLYGIPEFYDDDMPYAAMRLWVYRPHPLKEMPDYIAQIENRWRSLGETGVYDAPDINGAVGYIGRNAGHRNVEVQWFQDNLQYNLSLAEPPDGVTNEQLREELLRVARSIPSSLPDG